MTSYVIVRHEDGAFVAGPQSAHSYVRDVLKARLYPSREEAQRECCENESVRSLAEFFNR